MCLRTIFRVKMNCSLRIKALKCKIKKQLVEQSRMPRVIVPRPQLPAFCSPESEMEIRRTIRGKEMQGTAGCWVRRMRSGLWRGVGRGGLVQLVVWGRWMGGGGRVPTLNPTLRPFHQTTIIFWILRPTPSTPRPISPKNAPPHSINFASNAPKATLNRHFQLEKQELKIKLFVESLAARRRSGRRDRIEWDRVMIVILVSWNGVRRLFGRSRHFFAAAAKKQTQAPRGRPICSMTFVRTD